MTHPPAHPFIHQPPTHIFIHPPVYSPIHPPIYPSTHQTSIHLHIYLSTHPSIHSPIHHSSIHLSTCSLTHPSFLPLSSGSGTLLHSYFHHSPFPLVFTCRHTYLYHGLPPTCSPVPAASLLGLIRELSLLGAMPEPHPALRAF